MFSGVSTLNLDAKGRLAIPAKHRDVLAECCASRVVVTLNPNLRNPDINDRCLWLYPMNEWHQVARRIAALPDSDSQGRAMKRLMLGHAVEVELDSQGRILLPSELREFAELGKRIALVGMINKFEIWDESVWTGRRDRWLNEVSSVGGEMSEQMRDLVL